MRLKMSTALLSCAIAFPVWVQAQEVTANVGGLRGSTQGESTYSWSFGYRQTVLPHVSLGLTWLNEGHIPDHHRDGVAAQAWYDHAYFTPRFSLGVGIGPYRYSDTTSAVNRLYANDHGWGVLYSVTANWAATQNLSYQLRFNEVQAPGSARTSAILVGLNYRLPSSVVAPDPADASLRFPHGDELTVLAGESVVNSLASQSTFAKSIEYRHNFTRHFEGTVSWIDEGNTPLTERNGVAAQAWVVEPLFQDKLTIGMGLGPYLAADTYRISRDSERTGAKVAGLLTMSASYQITPHIVARVSWDRAITNYNRDTDIFLVGVGYRF